VPRVAALLWPAQLNRSPGPPRLFSLLVFSTYVFCRAFLVSFASLSRNEDGDSSASTWQSGRADGGSPSKRVIVTRVEPIAFGELIGARGADNW